MQTTGDSGAVGAHTTLSDPSPAGPTRRDPARHEPARRDPAVGDIGGRPDTVTGWLALGAAMDPGAPAVQHGHDIVSHADLDALGNRIAHYLIDRQVRPGDRVGLCLDRSIELVACLVGVLKCGAAYVPLDPTYPRDRLAMMQEDADLRLVLASDPHAAWIGGGEREVHSWSSIRPLLDGYPSSPVDVAPGPEDDAYIIFTSGSTGRPKGVEMPHRALANLVDWQLERATFRPQARVLQYSSVSFDVSFQEIATTIASGGHLFMVADGDRRDPRVLLRILRDWHIQRLFLPFVALRSLVEVASQADGFPPDLTEIITAGEQLRVDDVMRDVFARSPQPTLDNQYGPSETHVITAHLLDGDPRSWPDLPPIGRVLTNCTAVVLDAEMQPVAAGQIGEIHLGGRNLAHGYYGRDDQTAAAFVADPSDPEGRRRLYRTGDLALVDENGDIHYQGRVDHQVKIRGHRVEPGEINAVASRLDNVAQCLTHTFRKPNGSAYLVTYYTPKDGATVDPAELKTHLRAHLPEYMVPSFVIELDRIGFGPSGKVDYRALPDPRTEGTFAPPVYDTDTERRLAAIWSAVLDFPSIPADANFFDLGGDSLAAVTLFLQVSEEFGYELPLAALSQTPTIATLARRIDERGTLEHDGYRSLQVLQEGPADVPPLFLVHGGGGNVLIFAALAANLSPDQAVYAFQWSGWDGHRGERTIPEMAAAYKEELLRFAPEGPYRIGGHCIGGLIAIELAHLLVDDGAVVDGPLIISDSPNLGATSFQPENPRRRADTDERFERMAEELLSMVPSELRTGEWRGEWLAESEIPAPPPPPEDLGLVKSLLVRVPRITAFLMQVRQWMRIMWIKVLVALGRPVPMELRELFCTRELIRAAKAYRPTRPWDRDMVYFRTSTFEGSTMALSGWWDDMHMGFGELCTGRFDLHVVGGYHNDALQLTYSADRVREAFDITPVSSDATG